MDDPVAILHLVEVWPNGQRVPAQVQIGKPFRDDKGSWACPILITTVDEKIRHIHGEDSMQALCLAVQFGHRMLQQVVDRGGRLLCTGERADDADFPLNAYFRGEPAAGGKAE
jgi:hypothetical protein